MEGANTPSHGALLGAEMVPAGQMVPAGLAPLLMAESARLTEENAALKQELAAKKEEYTRALAKQENHEQRIQTLSTENLGMRGQIERLTKENGDLQKEITRLTKENDELRGHIGRLGGGDKRPAREEQYARCPHFRARCPHFQIGKRSPHRPFSYG